jgi:hypothetical protein
MHIHNLMNQAVDLNAAYAAQQREAEKEAAATRKKLFESAMRLASSQEDCVVSIGKQQENSEGQSKRKNPGESGHKKDDEHNDEHNNGSLHMSDWA